ncbi:MAG: DeoR/GlpR transcriptional regulator [Clostridia bacterium]|nr:DeoR/GlpR transcriptional regulator [Clostridia bacterium]
MSSERRASILAIIEDAGEASLAELCTRFSGVSEITIRRDLIQLEQEGHILRTRGGAVSLKRLGSGIPHPGSGEENEYFLRAHQNQEEKIALAKKALSFVEKGRSIYFDAGSTIMALAHLLPDEAMTIITNGTNVAQELVTKPKITVMMPGGTVNHNTLSVSGSTSISFIQNINIEYAFMSASAFSLDAGFSVSNIYEAELKRAVINRAKKVVMLLDSSKFDKSLLFTMAELADIDYLVCDRAPSLEIRKAAKAAGVQII